MTEPKHETTGRLHHGECTLYTGVTSDLVKRAGQHRNSEIPGFASRYGCKLLAWYELHADMPNAILREKELKAGSRKDKLKLIESANPACRDLYGDLV